MVNYLTTFNSKIIQQKTMTMLGSKPSLDSVAVSYEFVRVPAGCSYGSYR